MSESAKNIVNLFSEPSRIREVMAGPWEEISVDNLGSEGVTLISDDREHAGFVLRGVITGTTASGEVFTLRRGSAFAIPQGGEMSLSSALPASFLHVVLRV